MDVFERRIASLETKMDDVRERLARMDEWKQVEHRNHVWSMRVQYSVLLLLLIDIVRQILR
jgi:hypothetical protein